jgi:hypothetical protein
MNFSIQPSPHYPFRSATSYSDHADIPPHIAKYVIEMWKWRMPMRNSYKIGHIPLSEINAILKHLTRYEFANSSDNPLNYSK